MNLLGFHHVALQVHDVAKVAAFYVEVLGLPELARYQFDDGSLRSIWVGAHWKAQKGDPFIAIEHQRPTTPAGALGYSMVALRIEASRRKLIADALVSRGVAIEKETGWTMYVRDPEGNLVGLSHHPDAAP